MARYMKHKCSLCERIYSNEDDPDWVIRSNFLNYYIDKLNIQGEYEINRCVVCLANSVRVLTKKLNLMFATNSTVMGCIKITVWYEKEGKYRVVEKIVDKLTPIAQL